MQRTTIESKELDSLSYAGKIKVSVERGNKTISTREYHNAGMPNLFKFLCNALAGNYLDNLRPVQIKLFNWDRMNKVTPDNFKWSEAWKTENSPVPVSATPYMVYDSTPVIKKVANNDNAESGVQSEDDYHYETTFHFRIPGLVISESQACLVGFYANNAIDDYKNASAYYLFRKNNVDEWDALNLTTTNNFNIIIEWTLAIYNK